MTLSVHNGGAPIVADALPFVFEPLAREPSDAASHCIGLGLLIAGTVLSAHSDDIDVTSSNAAGTTRAARLPKGLA